MGMNKAQSHGQAAVVGVNRTLETALSLSQEDHEILAMVSEKSGLASYEDGGQFCVTNLSTGKRV